MPPKPPVGGPANKVKRINNREQLDRFILGGKGVGLLPNGTRVIITDGLVYLRSRIGPPALIVTSRAHLDPLPIMTPISGPGTIPGGMGFVSPVTQGILDDLRSEWQDRLGTARVSALNSLSFDLRYAEALIRKAFRHPRRPTSGKSGRRPIPLPGERPSDRPARPALPPRRPQRTTRIAPVEPSKSGRRVFPKGAEALYWLRFFAALAILLAMRQMAESGKTYVPGSAYDLRRKQRLLEETPPELPFDPPLSLPDAPLEHMYDMPDLFAPDTGEPQAQDAPVLPPLIADLPDLMLNDLHGPALDFLEDVIREWTTYRLSPPDRWTNGTIGRVEIPWDRPILPLYRSVYTPPVLPDRPDTNRPGVADVIEFIIEIDPVPHNPRAYLRVRNVPASSSEVLVRRPRNKEAKGGSRRFAVAATMFALKSTFGVLDIVQTVMDAFLANLVDKDGVFIGRRLRRTMARNNPEDGIYATFSDRWATYGQAAYLFATNQVDLDVGGFGLSLLFSQAEDSLIVRTGTRFGSFSGLNSFTEEFDGVSWGSLSTLESQAFDAYASLGIRPLL